MTITETVYILYFQITDIKIFLYESAAKLRRILDFHLVPIRDSGAFKARTLAAKLLHRVQTFKLEKSENWKKKKSALF